jgi:hypothetical protein
MSTDELSLGEAFPEPGLRYADFETEEIGASIMNCAWCSPSDNGSDGICDACMLLYFNVNPATIHAEIATESNTIDKQQNNDSPCFIQLPQPNPTSLFLSWIA